MFSKFLKLFGICFHDWEDVCTVSKDYYYWCPSRKSTGNCQGTNGKMTWWCDHHRKKCMICGKVKREK